MYANCTDHWLKSTITRKESQQQKQVQKRSTFASILPPICTYFSPKKPTFSETVKMGDILITKRGIGGLVGHAAIMGDDDSVLEMPGGEGWQYGIENNNRLIGKYDWFNLHLSDFIIVYRNKDHSVAREAAKWAMRKYYNSNGGTQKTEHVTYLLTMDFQSTTHSYCSKLVVQAYDFGTGDRKVIKDTLLPGRIIVPNTIPNYFLSPYTLERVWDSFDVYINFFRDQFS